MEPSFDPQSSPADEELTANDQLQRRNADLDVVNNDLTNLLVSIGIPVLMVSGDLRLRRISGPAGRAMNILPTDLGRPLGVLSIGTAVPGLAELVREVIEHGRTVERELTDREGRWSLMRVHPYRTSDGRIDGAVIVLLDLDQMRHAQAELREKTAQLSQLEQLMGLSQDAIIVRDANNLVQSWNRGAQEMYGWPEDDVKGRPLEQVLQTDLASWRGLNEELDRTGFWEGELHQMRRDGTPIIIHSREVLVRDEHGGRSAVLSIKRDITELRRVIKALHEADRRKDEFLATLAHELRNPLAPVRNAVEIMRIAGDNPATVARVRDMLDRQVQQLSRIVDDLIDVTRIVEKKIDLRRELVSLTQVVDTALETCRSRIEGRRQRLSVSLPVAPIVIDVDPVRMSQVLINLLDNASKYTDAGGQIWLSAEPLAGGNGADHPSVAIRVRDTGIGIPSELLPDVFDMFTQGARTREQGRGGLGVGLTLVRSLVEMHSGVITAESEGVGKGSEFVVRLPMSDDAAAATAHPAGPTRDAEPGPVRILVVDDSQDHAETLGMLLRLMGHEVQLAASGPEALEGVARFKPDVALVDIGLPGMNGYEVARRIREQPKYRGMVLVAQTGWGQTEDRIRSKEAGFDFHLVKPVDRDELEAILRDVKPA